MDEIERKILHFIETHKPNTQFYINENLEVKKGPIKYPRCMFCNIDLETIRKNNPRRRMIKFCSEKCQKEHNRRKKIREKLGENVILVWNTGKGKPLVRKDMKVNYVREGKEPLQVPFKAKTSKWARNSR